MKICPKCGKQLPDETIYCPGCGSAAGNSYAGGNAYNGNNAYANNNAYGNNNFYAGGNPYATPGPSMDYMAIRQFSEKAKTIRNFGIIAAILMCGVGIIFSIVIWVMMNGLTEPFVTTTNPYELAALESARKDLKLGKILSFLPVGVLVLSFMIGFIGGLAGV